MITEKEKKIFLEYFDKNKNYSEDCLRNYKDRKVVFLKR